MKLTWSEAGNGNWNGKAGPYTIMVVSYHDEGVFRGWRIHPKLPGLKGRVVLGPLAGKATGDRLFAEWLQTIGIKGGLMNAESDR
jgi:hypothetical protein